MPNLKLLALAIAQILKGTPKFSGAPLAQGHVHCFFSVGFYKHIVSIDVASIAERTFTGDPCRPTVHYATGT